MRKAKHTFASQLAMRGVPLFDIKKLLDHSDVKTTLKYMHLAPDDPLGKTDVLMRETLKPKEVRNFGSSPPMVGKYLNFS